MCFFAFFFDEVVIAALFNKMNYYFFAIVVYHNVKLFFCVTAILIYDSCCLVFFHKRLFERISYNKFLRFLVVPLKLFLMWILDKQHYSKSPYELYALTFMSIVTQYK